MKYPYMCEKILYAIFILRSPKSNGRYLNPSDFTCYTEIIQQCQIWQLFKVVQRNPSGHRASSGQGRCLRNNSNTLILYSHNQSSLHYFRGQNHFERNRGVHSNKPVYLIRYVIIKVNSQQKLIGSINKLNQVEPFETSDNFHKNKKSAGSQSV